MTASGSSRFISIGGTGLAVLCSRVVSLGAAAVQLPLLTNMLDPASYALVAAAIATGSYVSLAAAEAPTLAFQRFPGSEADRRNYVFGRRQLLLAVCVISPLLLLAGVLTGQLETVVAAIGWGFGLGTIGFVSAAWLMWMHPWRYALALMSSTVLRTAVLVTLVYMALPASIAVGAAGFASGLLTLALAPRGRRGGSADQAKSDERPWRLNFGVSLAIGSACITIMQNLDIILLPKLSEASEAGSYAAMATVALLTVGAVLSMINISAFPHVLRTWNAGNPAAARTLALRLCCVAFGITSLALIGLYVVGPYTLERVLGAEYYTLRFATGLMAGTGVYAIAQIAIWTHKLDVQSSRIRNRSIVAASVNLLLLGVGVPLLGATAAILATVSSFLIYSLLMQWQAGLGWRIRLCTLFLAGIGTTSQFVSSGTLVIVTVVVSLTMLLILLPLIQLKADHAKRS